MTRDRLYTALKDLVRDLTTYVPNVQFVMDKAGSSVKTPYIVFRVEDIIDTSPTLNTTIRFMCYDDENATSTTNNLHADVIRNHFNKKQFVFDDISLHTTLSIEQTIPAEYLTDKQVIELQFDATIYERN